MSVPVELERLRTEVSRRGDTPYLLTVADDGRPHTVSVRVTWSDASLVLAGGSRSRSHASVRPDVTLLWPAVDEGGFSLIVDGTASVFAEQIAVHPVSAVLHRSLAASHDGTAGSECRPVLSPESGT